MRDHDDGDATPQPLQEYRATVRRTITEIKRLLASVSSEDESRAAKDLVEYAARLWVDFAGRMGRIVIAMPPSKRRVSSSTRVIDRRTILLILKPYVRGITESEVIEYTLSAD